MPILGPNTLSSRFTRHREHLIRGQARWRKEPFCFRPRLALMKNRTSLGPTPARELTIVIPAFNEAEAIAGTLQRCLAARESIRQEGNLQSVDVIVVSDGSTDGTGEIARGFPGVHVHEFPRNRGYGAAIKYGFQQGTGDLVGFLDADGTCDPRFFGVLCRVLDEEDADMALGSRMSPESRMPWVRSLGNRLYALLVSVLSNQQVSDTASGMRVLKRSALQELGPLPDGLHFTPAMSARAILGGLTVAEVPMSYEERIGESKLRVFRDGWRFLQAIADGLLLFRPERTFVVLAVVALAAAVALTLNPLEFYIKQGRLEEWMIYRFVVAFLLGSAGALALTATALVSRMSELALDRGKPPFWIALLVRSFQGVRLVVLLALLLIVSFLLLKPGIAEYLSTGHLTLHWSRVIVAAFALLLAFQAVLTAILLRITTLWLEFAAAQRGPPSS